ncbi:MAG TPA: cytochrome b N-terminal domain-containing protein, partial [Anaerolineales bacterium]
SFLDGADCHCNCRFAPIADFYTASFKRPRELNWYIGLGLLFVTLGAVCTASVLKYDQEGLEALQHSKEAGELMGALGAFFTSGFSRSASLLSRLFTTHVSILPMAFAALIGAHIYLINQHGISPKATTDATARKTKGEGESRFDIHLRSMIGYGLILLAGVMLLALLLPAPIGQHGMPGTEITKPWWMFVWLFPAEAAVGARALIEVSHENNPFPKSLDRFAPQPFLCKPCSGAW